MYTMQRMRTTTQLSLTLLYMYRTVENQDVSSTMNVLYDVIYNLVFPILVLAFRATFIFKFDCVASRKVGNFSKAYSAETNSKFSLRS